MFETRKEAVLHEVDLNEHKMASFDNATSTNGTETFAVLNNTTPTNGSDNAWIEQYEEATWLRVFRVSLFSLIILASLIGNSVVCKAVWSMPFFKPFCYHLVANMAFAEILSSLCLPVVLANWDYSVLNNVNCVLNPLQVLSLMVVTYSMAVIAFYRYKVLIKPIPQGPGPSQKVKIVTIVSLWLVPTAICVPLFLRYKYENGECIRQSLLYNETYVLVRFVLNFVIPYFVMLASYGAVAWSFRNRIEQKVKNALISMHSVASTGPSPTAVFEIEDQVELQGVAENQETEGRPKEERRGKLLVDESNRRRSKLYNADLEKDLLKMIFVIILIFVICYFPYQAMFLWQKIAKIDSWQFRYHKLMQKYMFILTCLPGALHPLCYKTMNTFYAKAFKKIFLCKT